MKSSFAEGWRAGARRRRAGGALAMACRPMPRASGRCSFRSATPPAPDRMERVLRGIRAGMRDDGPAARATSC